MSKEAIDSPVVESPDVFVALSLSAYKTFKHQVTDGIIIYDPAFVTEIDDSLPCTQKAIPAKDISVEKLGKPVFANTLMLGVLAKVVDELDPGVVLESILHIIPKFHEENKQAFQLGYSLLEE